MADEDTKEVGRAGVLFLFGTTLSMLAGLVLRVVLARELSVSDFGTVFVFLSLLNILSTPCLLGLNQGITKFVSDEQLSKSETDTYITVTLVTVVVASGLVTSTLLVIGDPLFKSFFDSSIDRTIISVLLLAMPAYAVFTVTKNTLRGMMESRAFVLLSKIACPGGKLVVISVIAILVSSATAAVTGLLAVLIVVALFGVGLLLSSGWEPTFDSNTNVTDIFRFSLPLVISSSVYILLSHFDKVALTYFIDSASVGRYEVIVTMSSLLLLFHSAFSFLIFPKVSEMVSNGNPDKINPVYQQATKWILGLTTPLYAVLLVIPGPFVRIFGPEYGPTELAFPLAVFAGGMYVDAVLGPNGEALLGFGRSKIVLLQNVTAVSINVILNVLFIPRFGLLGAATASLIAYLVMNLLRSIDLAITHDITPINRDSIVMAACSFLSAGIVALLLPSTETLISEIFAIALVGAVSFGVGVAALVTIGGVSSADEELLYELREQVPL